MCLGRFESTFAFFPFCCILTYLNVYISNGVVLLRVWLIFLANINPCRVHRLQRLRAYIDRRQNVPEIVEIYNVDQKCSSNNLKSKTIGVVIMKRFQFPNPKPQVEKIMETDKNTIIGKINGKIASTKAKHSLRR